MFAEVSREERRLIRQRGAGTRELKGVDFGFNFGGGLARVTPPAGRPVVLAPVDHVDESEARASAPLVMKKRERSAPHFEAIAEQEKGAETSGESSRPKKKRVPAKSKDPVKAPARKSRLKRRLPEQDASDLELADAVEEQEHPVTATTGRRRVIRTAAPVPEEPLIDPGSVLADEGPERAVERFVDNAEEQAPALGLSRSSAPQHAEENGTVLCGPDPPVAKRRVRAKEQGSADSDSKRQPQPKRGRKPKAHIVPKETSFALPTLNEDAVQETNAATAAPAARPKQGRKPKAPTLSTVSRLETAKLDESVAVPSGSALGDDEREKRSRSNRSAGKAKRTQGIPKADVDCAEESSEPHEHTRLNLSYEPGDQPKDPMPFNPTKKRTRIAALKDQTPKADLAHADSTHDRARSKRARASGAGPAPPPARTQYQPLPPREPEEETCPPPKHTSAPMPQPDPATASQATKPQPPKQTSKPPRPARAPIPTTTRERKGTEEEGSLGAILARYGNPRIPAALLAGEGDGRFRKFRF